MCPWQRGSTAVVARMQGLAGLSYIALSTAAAECHCGYPNAHFVNPCFMTSDPIDSAPSISSFSMSGLCNCVLESYLSLFYLNLSIKFRALFVMSAIGWVKPVIRY